MNVPAYHEAVKWGFQMGLLSVRRSLLDICNASPKPGSKQVKPVQDEKQVIVPMKTSED